MNGDTNRSLWAARRDEHTLCMTVGKKTAEAVEAGARVRKLRDAKKFSLAKLSRLTGGRLAGPRISNYEQGLRTLDIRAARILAGPLGAHPAYLMGLLTEEEHRFLKALERTADRPFLLPAPLPLLPAKNPLSEK